MSWHILFALLFGYALGSVPFALITSKLFGLPDPRTFGSKNPGATNVLRTGHKGAALLTLIGDAGKGAAAVLIAQAATQSPTLAAAAGLGAFLGHVFSYFLRFQGGKGVATALGVLLAIQPLLGLIAALIWLTVAVVSRYSSLAALIAALLTPPLAWLLNRTPAEVALVTVLAVILIARHHQNIRNLLQGTESKIGAKAATASADGSSPGNPSSPENPT
ncbi:glycerol-3-phosphate 1-O-acyltransferase PlsY [Hydrogenophilus thermoluteolus]|uniref:glycerol-3-phosphate 1-O-acyltransferase PlsY n=1 Tax=Hydrogenophilus thermoluteolus TaxID=297 RepID=UPI002C83ED0D|nr:glycerol-3-phosphate 1-O-acyltransferase PlsY [Hydrogenophilus thermoluteolus]